MNKPKLSHSYSAIKMFEQCPQKYYRLRIKKDVKDTMSAEADWGNQVHKALEERIRDHKESSLATPYERLVQAIERVAGTTGLLRAEQELVFDRKLEGTTWWSSKAWIRMKLDVVAVRGDTAVIWDWKTGKRRPDPFQLDMYAAAAFRKYRQVNKVAASLVWLKTTEMDTEKYERKAHQKNLWTDVLGRIARIEEEVDINHWPTRPSPLCNWCPAKGTCPDAWRR